jgi:maltose/maltodextrin transport system substrate-binding protein/arabinogalactan oligomer/maltooligosaccharide transport system substrate-binding protein
MKHRSILMSLIVLVALSLTIIIAPAAAQEEGLLVWADGTRTPILTELAAQFTEEFGINMTVQEVGMGDIRANLPIAGPAGEGPDVIVAAHDWIGELVLNGSVVPINIGDKADDFTEGSLKLFTYNDQLYGVPYAVENVAFFRNPELVPDAPETWDEVAAITEELVSSGASEYGFLTYNQYHFFPIMSAFGGYIFGLDENGNYDPTDVGLDSEGTLAAANWVNDMARAGYIPTGVDYAVLHDLFEAGDAAMIITGPWALPRIRESGIPYAISDIPAGPDGPGKPLIGGQGFMISAYSENQLLAEGFLLEFMATEEPMKALYDADPRPPALKSLLESLADPDLEAFQAAGVEGLPQPSIPEMAKVWGAWDNALNFTISGEAEPDAAFAEAAEIVRAQIAGAVTGDTTSETGETVVLPGTIQSALGCAGDWDPACADSRLIVGEDDGVWTNNFVLPAGDYEYKVALNGTWDENYGAGGERDGANITLSLAEETNVTFVFDPVSHYIADSVNTRLVTAPGSYQAAMGCPGDWAPDCLLSWLTDADGDGVYTLTTTAIPAGDYEVKAAINQSWDENYGLDAQRDGPNIPFSVPSDGAEVTFSFDNASNTLTVAVGG